MGADTYNRMTDDENGRFVNGQGTCDPSSRFGSLSTPLLPLSGCFRDEWGRDDRPLATNRRWHSLGRCYRRSAGTSTESRTAVVAWSFLLRWPRCHPQDDSRCDAPKLTTLDANAACMHASSLDRCMAPPSRQPAGADAFEQRRRAPWHHACTSCSCASLHRGSRSAGKY